MDSIVSLPRRIVEWLSSQDDMDDINFFVEYPPINKAVPLRNTIVAVGIESIDMQDKFVENDDGVLERQEYCRLAIIKANLSICVPFSLGGSTCHDIFTRIADALTFRTNLNISSSNCSKIESDRDTDALVMKGCFLMEADFCPAQSTDENFESFLNRELICGSHVSNTSIHVTSEDKEKWNSPYVIGFYLGTGSASKTVSLDFKPSIVFLTAAGYPPVTVNFTNSIAKSYLAFANESYGSLGITLTNTGFRINSPTIGGVTAQLNEAGTSYMYIAFK